MPELPEVETIVRALARRLVKKRIKQAALFTTRLRLPVTGNLSRQLAEKRIIAVVRRAKYILIHLDSGRTLVIHLGMTGSIRIRDRSTQAGKLFARARHDHLWLQLDDGSEMVFSDPRRFGLLALLETENLELWAPLATLGPEPLERKFTAATLHERLAGRKVSIKQALMNQEIVVGVGNIYASEALFLAGIKPTMAAGRISSERLALLVKSIKKVLRASISAGGSTLKDYRQANGETGFFQSRFSVYDRAGQRCPGCCCDPEKSGGIQRIVQGGRSTFYCPVRQR